MTLTPKEFAFADGALAEAINLPVREGGWGLLLCLDERDLRYTLAGDPDYLRTLCDIAPDAVPGTVSPVDLAAAGIGDMELSLASWPLRKRGWPDTWNRKEQRAYWQAEVAYIDGQPVHYLPDEYLHLIAENGGK